MSSAEWCTCARRSRINLFQSSDKNKNHHVDGRHEQNTAFFWLGLWGDARRTNQEEEVVSFFTFFSKTDFSPGVVISHDHDDSKITGGSLSSSSFVDVFSPRIILSNNCLSQDLLTGRLSGLHNAGESGDGTLIQFYARDREHTIFHSWIPKPQNRCCL